MCITGASYDVVEQLPKLNTDPAYRVIVPKLVAPQKYCIHLVAIQVARLISFYLCEEKPREIII